MTAGMEAETIDDRAEALLEFWFEGPPDDADRLRALFRKWFAGGPAQDRALGERCGALAESAARGELDSWARNARERLALIILLDQLPRSLRRGTPDAFAQDPKALGLCLQGLDAGDVESLAPLERLFFCMPLQHAESPEIQALSARTFSELATADAPPPVAAMLESAAEYADEHRKIVDRFGRFPHRNRILGREPTNEEREFLASGGPSFGQ